MRKTLQAKLSTTTKSEIRPKGTKEKSIVIIKKPITGRFFLQKMQFFDIIRYSETIYKIVMTKKNKELEEAKKWLKMLLEEAPDAFFLSDLKGVFIAANKAAEKIIGYERKELIGKSMLQVNILPKEQIPIAMKRIAQHALGKPVTAGELELIRKDGSRVSIEITGNVLKLEGQIFILGIVRDITERKQTEKEIKERKELLERFRKIATGREIKMIELKNRIQELEKKLKQQGRK